MVARACKHLLNRLLRASLTCDHAALIAHFFNCLVGTGLEPSPSPELVDLPPGAVAAREWASLTPTSLRAQVVTEVESRFRYTIPASFFNSSSLIPTRLVREVCMRVGVQLVLREYKFVGDGTATSTDEEKIEPAEVPKKKKKSSGKKGEREAAKADEQRTVTFRADDVLNTMPVIKASVHKVSCYLSGCENENSFRSAAAERARGRDVRRRDRRARQGPARPRPGDRPGRDQLLRAGLWRRAPRSSV